MSVLESTIDIEANRPGTNHDLNQPATTSFSLNKIAPKNFSLLKSATYVKTIADIFNSYSTKKTITTGFFNLALV